MTDTETQSVPAGKRQPGSMGCVLPPPPLPGGRFSPAVAACLSRAVLACLFLIACPPVGGAPALERREWTVEGVARQALVYVPPVARTNPAPVVFAFHGHGGTMQNAARTFGFHSRWPEAIVIYPQGLNTPGRLTDPEGKKPGWQKEVGDQSDRDLKFFDAMLASLQQDFKVDARRIYATGHSNGGGFTYLLWAARGEKFAAVAPSASAAARAFAQLKPKPVLHVAGENDTLVKFAWQQQTMAALRRLNQSGEGQPWENEKGCTLYPAKAGPPVVTFIHPGTHQYPAAAPALIVKFFQQHALPVAPKP
jgi:polyhydroxybutyrate depolymerase